MSNELKSRLDAYLEKFGDGFPTMEISATDDEYIKMIDKCIKKNKDAYEMGFVVLDNDIYY